MKHLLLTTLFIVGTAFPLAAQQPQSVDQPKITVTGESLVYARPDKIVLNFGIETRDNQLLPAKQKNAAIWKKAAAALKESGVPNKDVQTDYLSIEPRYRNYNEIDEPIGYVARNMFVVTISDPAKVEGLISEMLALGVNHVNGIEFQTTDFKRLRESARELALRRREKAEKMAAALGCSVANLWQSTSPMAAAPGTSPVGRAGDTVGRRWNVAERDSGPAWSGRRRAPRDGPGKDFDPCRRIRDACAEAGREEAKKP